MAEKINLEFQKAVEKKRILHFSKGKALIKKELEAAKFLQKAGTILK